MSKKLRQYLIDNIDGSGGFGTKSRQVRVEQSDDNSSSDEEDEDGRRKMRLRRRDHVDYDTVDDDDEFFARLHAGGSSPEKRHKAPARGRMKKEKTTDEIGREYALREASTSPLRHHR